MSLSLVSEYALWTPNTDFRPNFVIRDNNFYVVLRDNSSSNVHLFKIDLLNKNYINLTDKIGGPFNYPNKTWSVAITPNETIILPVGLLDKNDNFYPGSLILHSDSVAASNHVCGTLITNSLISTRDIRAGCFTIPNIFYLGSINNLSTPITKTSDHTMKITYILTEE